jgi:lysophospholipase L1-like esterase
VPPPNYEDAASFVGYPEDIGAGLGWRVANAACPGETSASLIAENVQSNGCENSPGGGPGYRSAFPLHVHYTGTQLQYAVRYLRAHPTTRLVSLMIGANDAFLCEETTKDDCASELPAVLKQIRDNVADILSAVRSEAHYSGQIIILNYYSLDYANAVDNAESQALNQAMDSGARPFGVQIANGYTAFENAALHSGGNTCTAGLLTQLSGGGCGVHPSVSGQAVLAQAVEDKIAH